MTDQGHNHGWKVEGDQDLDPNKRPTPGQRTGLGVVRVRWYHPGKFVKTQMPNPAFWWLLAVEFLAFWKLWPRSWGDQYIVGGTSLPRFLWLLRLCDWLSHSLPSHPVQHISGKICYWIQWTNELFVNKHQPDSSVNITAASCKCIYTQLHSITWNWRIVD